MIARLKFLITYLLLWVLFFDLARVMFLLAQWKQTTGLTASQVFNTFLYGLRMDLSMAAYFTLPVCIFVIAGIFISFFNRPFIYKLYTGILLFFVLLVLVCDVEVFRQWGFRIDSTPLKYLDSPKEVWASVSHLPVALYLLLFLLLYLLFLLGFNIAINRMCNWLQRKTNPVFPVILCLLFTAFLIVPIRGGFQLTPMNQSIVYFSANNFANQAAVNAPWNLMYTLVSETGASKNPYAYMSAAEAKITRDSLYRSDTGSIRLLNTSRPNIILIVWESFTAKATKLSINGKEVTPHFNELKKQGIYFSNAYASGDRTDKGVAAVLAGYPALPKTSVIRLPAKVRTLETIPGVYKKQGYNTSFYYGGETEFANIKSFIIHNGFDRIIDKSSFSGKDLNSKWGAHDGVVAGKILNDISKQRQPFLTTWLTLSSHEPFETPVPVVFNGNDHTRKFLNSIHYTDAVINEFILSCSKLPSWNNTIVVIVADHGHPLPETGNKIDNFTIPILMLGGALVEKGITVDSVCSQLDIAATLTGLTHLPANFPFSKNVFSNVKKWSYFSFNDGFGFVNSGGYVIYDNIGKSMLSHSSKAGPDLLHAGQAMQQYSYQDYVDR